VNLKEELKERAIAEDAGIEGHFHRFGVAIVVGIGRIIDFTAYVADARRDDALGSAQQILHAPEAAAGENCSLACDGLT
jgi:hypothetical protein